MGYRRITAERREQTGRERKGSGTEPFLSLLFSDFPVDTLVKP
jgi:hypothetical protein